MPAEIRALAPKRLARPRLRGRHVGSRMCLAAAKNMGFHEIGGEDGSIYKILTIYLHIISCPTVLSRGNPRNLVVS